MTNFSKPQHTTPSEDPRWSGGGGCPPSPPGKPSRLICARGCVRTAGVFLQSLFFQRQGPRSSCCCQGEQGRCRVLDEPKHCPPYDSHRPPRCRGRQHHPRAREGRSPGAVLSSPRPGRCPCSSTAGRRAQPPPLGERAATTAPVPTRPAPPGLRLQHWNKTYSITSLFLLLFLFVRSF